KLTPTLATLLVHDFLLSKDGIAAPEKHPLKIAVLKNKTRLKAEFTKIRIRNGYTTLDDFRNDVEIGHSAKKGKQAQEEQSMVNGVSHPRWVRINGLKADERNCFSIFSSYTRVDSLPQVIDASQDDLVFFVDDTVPGLVALPPGHDLRLWAPY